MSYGNRRFRRLAATGALALGTFALLPASPASAARPTDDACPAGLAEDSFTDTGDDGSAIESAVDCVAAYGVTSGTSATTFDPSGTVTRAQMATFIMNKLDLVDGFERPANAPNAFTDDEGDTHEANINDAAALEIVEGFTDDVNDDGQTPDYQPSGQVTRAQMATFIVNSLEAAGFDLPEVPEDTEFTDLEGNVHADNIKILEELDIVDGLAEDNNGDGETPDFGPDNPVSRGQMAFFLTRDIDVLVDEGLVEPVPGASNESLTVTPDDAARLTRTTNPEAVANPADDRQYMATGLEDGTTYTIQVFPAANVMTNGAVTFAEDGTTNTADVGTVAADITVVNGTVVGTPDDNATAQPVNGQIAFTVDGDTPESVVPVVYVDADSDGNLDLDADNAPTEAFGIGGVVRYVPDEAETGFLTTNVPIEEVDKDADEIFTNDDLFVYDDNDAFFIDADNDGCEATEQVTLSAFEAQVSADDSLAGSVANETPDDTFYQSTDALSSSFCLLDTAPGQPTLTATGALGKVDVVIMPAAALDADDTINLQRANVDDGADNICGGAGAGDDTIGAYSTLKTLTTADDEDAATAGIQFTDTAEPGCYSYRASVTVDGESSENSTAVTAESQPDNDEPDITDASTTDVDDGVGTTNSIVVTFSEAVTLDISKITVHPTAQPGLVFEVTEAEAANETGTKWVLTIDTSLNDALANVNYDIDTEAGAYKDAAGNANVPGNPDHGFSY